MKVRDLEWWIIGILGFIAFFLAAMGFNIMFTEAGIERNLLDLAFQSMKIYAMEFVDEFQSPLPWQLEVARWLAPGVLLYTAGKAILYFIHREFKSLRLKGYKDHVIITSLNDKARYLIKDLLKNNKEVIVIAGIENPKKLDAVEKEGAVIVEGDISNNKFLKNIAARNAKYFVFIDDDDEVNISSALTIYEHLKTYSKNLNQVLFTHVADDIKLNELIELHFFEERTNKKEAGNNCEIRIISINERAARILFHNYSPDIFTPITSPDAPAPHIALFGSNDLTQSVLIRIARLGHYANFKKIKITLFHEGNYVIKKLEQNFPALFDLVELNYINKPLELFDIAEFNTLHKEHNFSAAYILCKDDSIASEILKKLTYVESDEKLNVVLTLTNPDGILSKWYKGELIKNVDLKKFNIIEESFTKEALISENLDKLAMIIHNEYLKGFEEGKLDPENKATHREWTELPVEAKNQNREQADHIFVKLRALNCEAVDKTSVGKKEFDYAQDVNMIEQLAKIEHNRWWASKLLAGWKWAEVEDGKKKLHNNLVEYEKLDPEIQELDRNAVRNMKELLLKDDLIIVKKETKNNHA